MAYRGMVRKAVCSALAVGALTFGMTAFSVTSATPSGASEPTTATWAEAPQTPPNYIFPFMSLAFFSVSNINQFQYLMYRPLYWFGEGTTPNLNPSLSLADQPVYSNGDTTVNVTLKHYKWSNGETVTAQDVMFWMNMLHSEKANWAAYAPGGSNIPDNVKSITIDSPTELTFNLTQAFNSYWYTYNQLSQITPLPVAWDKTSEPARRRVGWLLERRLRHRRRRLRRGVHLPVQPGGLQPEQPQGGEQLAAHLRHQPAVAGGRRAVEAQVLRLVG